MKRKWALLMAGGYGFRYGNDWKCGRGRDEHRLKRNAGSLGLTTTRSIRF